MDISNKINNLIQIKSDLKSILLSKGVITSTTPFMDYPAAVNNLSKPVEMATLKFAFDNNYYYNLLSGDCKYAYTTKYKSYFKINGIDRWDLLKDRYIFKGTTQTKFTVSVEVPKNTNITWELLAYISTSKSDPYARVLYTDKYSNYVYNNKPETGTVKITGSSYTVTMKIKYITDLEGIYS